MMLGENYQSILYVVVFFFIWAIFSNYQTNRLAMLKACLYEFMVLALLAIVVIGFKSLTYEHYFIPSSSMHPTLHKGDHLLASKFAYGYSKHSLPIKLDWLQGRLFAQKAPARGDIIIFMLDKLYVKRLIGLPGDRVKLIDGEIWLNGQRLEREYVGSLSYRQFSYKHYLEHLTPELTYSTLDLHHNMPLDNIPEITIPAGYYYAMGDNRDNSDDSRRSLGLIPAETIIAQAKIVLFSHRYDLWEFWRWPESFVQRWFKTVR